MSTGSTYRRLRQRSGGSINKQEPVSMKNLLWLLEKAKREVTKRQSRLDEAMAVLAHYWVTLTKAYPDEAKAILEYEAEYQRQMTTPQQNAEVVVPTESKEGQ